MEGKTHHEFVVGTWVTVELGKDTGWTGGSSTSG